MIKKMLLWLIGSSFLLLLVACQSLPQIQHLPVLKEAKLFQVSPWRHQQAQATSLLIIQPQDQDTWRWILVDALGAPISRQTLHRGVWENDGFLPPNHEARALFVAVYAYLMQGMQTQAQQSSVRDVTIQEHAQGALVSLHAYQWLLKEVNDE